MVERVYNNIYRIGVELPGNPLKELNSYFIRGDEYDLLIDTGFRMQACQKALEEGLKELHSDKKRRRVLITHVHADHSGMADLFRGPDQLIYMSEQDLQYRYYLDSKPAMEHWLRFLDEGFPRDLFDLQEKQNPAFSRGMPSFHSGMCPLHDGERLQVGDYELEMILVPGHTPGNSMFYIRREKIMFTGDHVLFDITPNITCWPVMPDALGSYLESLEKALQYSVKLALPGHRQTGDYEERIAGLKAHHQRRLNEALKIIRANPGITGYQTASRMKWKIRAAGWEGFPLTQKWFAMGECLSHLDHLLRIGAVRKQMKDQVFTYYAN